MERRGVFAVLGVSKMREELGEGQGVEEGVQNTWRDGLLVIAYYFLMIVQVGDKYLVFFIVGLDINRWHRWGKLENTAVTPAVQRVSFYPPVPKASVKFSKSHAVLTCLLPVAPSDKELLETHYKLNI